jgi:hypothetical protein
MMTEYNQLRISVTMDVYSVTAVATLKWQGQQQRNRYVLYIPLLKSTTFITLIMFGEE